MEWSRGFSPFVLQEEHSTILECTHWGGQSFAIGGGRALDQGHTLGGHYIAQFHLRMVQLEMLPYGCDREEQQGVSTSSRSASAVRPMLVDALNSEAPLQHPSQ